MRAEEATGQESGANSTKQSHVPSYARPNVSCQLPDYSNQAAEAIRAAFVPNTYRTLQSLTAASSIDLAPFRAGSGTATTFSDFVYECSPYDLRAEQVAKDRQDHQEKLARIAAADFVPAASLTGRVKYEDYAFEYMSEPYDGPQEYERQQRFLENSKCLARPFVPTGCSKTLQKPTRILLGDIMAQLFRIIEKDWSDAQPTVLSTAEDLIVVYFKVDLLKHTSGVLTYMNNALRRNEAIMQYDLRKVNEGWNILTEDRHIMFTLRPPWVRPQKFLGAENNQALSNAPTPSEI